MNRKIPKLLLLLLVAIVMGGCALIDGDEKKETDEEITNVTVINDIEEVDEEEVIVDQEETDEVVVEEEEETPDTSETKPDTQSDVTIPAKFTGTTTQLSRVSGYMYEVTGGKLLFKWKLRSDVEGVYPKFEILDGDTGSVIVKFPSLTSDAVAKEDSQFSLEGQLPDMKWSPEGEGSRYEFLFESKRQYEVTDEVDEDDELWLVLSITL